MALHDGKWHPAALVTGMPSEEDGRTEARAGLSQSAAGALKL